MNSDTTPSFAYRLFLALVKTILVGILLAALVVGGYFGLRELLRSFDSVNARIDINRNHLDALQGQVDTLAADVPEQQHDIAELQVTAADLAARQESLQAELSSDLDRQRRMLTALEERVETAATDSQTAAQDTAALGTALVALQGDFNETNSRIDVLGGELDEVGADSETLSNSIELLSQSVISATEQAAEISDLQQTLALFHIWELVARARLRLVEDNIGLATEDLERALRAVDIMVANEPDEGEEGLQVLQTRLALARASLPDNSLLATSDLESVWDELDKIVTSRVLPELLSLLESETAGPAVEEGVLEASPEATATPEPATSPEAVPATTPEPTATSTP